MNKWIERLFEDPDQLRMGHCQSPEDANLGLGWLYYGLARLMRPREVVVIGSYRGFAPMVFAKALADNADPGRVTFIDPSMVDDHWKDAESVKEHFASFGVANIRHFLMTTQEFVTTPEFAALDEVGLVMIDGYHSEEQARFDFESFVDRVPDHGVLLLHDSIKVARVNIYGPDRAYERRVKFFVDKLKDDARYQVLDLPYATGLTLVRKCG